MHAPCCLQREETLLHFVSLDPGVYVIDGTSEVLPTINYLKFLIVFQGLCPRKWFCWRLKALGHTILVTKAKGAFVQVGDEIHFLAQIHAVFYT